MDSTQPPKQLLNIKPMPKDELVNQSFDIYMTFSKMLLQLKECGVGPYKIRNIFERGKNQSWVVGHLIMNNERSAFVTNKMPKKLVTYLK